MVNRGNISQIKNSPKGRRDEKITNGFGEKIFREKKRADM